jgi:hypothetical protein
MMTLQRSIASLAETFATSVLAAIRSASLEEILSEGKGGRASSPSTLVKRGPGRPRKEASVGPKPAKVAKGGRLPRRSEDEIKKVAGVIVSALKSAPEGLRSEHLQRVLKLSKKEIVGPLNLALSEKKISKKGQRRSTTYFAK